MSCPRPETRTRGPTTTSSTMRTCGRAGTSTRRCGRSGRATPSSGSTSSRPCEAGQDWGGDGATQLGLRGSRSHSEAGVCSSLNLGPPPLLSYSSSFKKRVVISVGIFWGWGQWKLPWFIFPNCIIVPNGPDLIAVIESFPVLCLQQD